MEIRITLSQDDARELQAFASERAPLVKTATLARALLLVGLGAAAQDPSRLTRPKPTAGGAA